MIGTGLMRRKTGYLALAAIGAAAMPLVLAFTVATGVFPLLALLIHPILIAFSAWHYGTTSTKNAKFDDGAVRVGGSGDLHFVAGGVDRLLAEKSELQQGFLVPTDSGVLVRIERNGLGRPPFFVRVKDEGEGLELLRALGFDAEHVAVEIRAASGLLAMSVSRQLLYTLLPSLFMVVTTLGIAFGFGRAAGLPLGVEILAFLAYIFGISFTPTKVRIGTDGVFTTWLGRKRFYPLSEIREAKVYSEIVGTKRQLGVRLFLANGEQVRIPTGQTDLGLGDAKRLAHRIAEAAAARSVGAHRPANLLERGSRTMSAWIGDLRRLGAGVLGHRDAAVPLDVLLGTVENSSAPAITRASAAVAAVANAEEGTEAARRIRVAADAIASPKLRIALTRIADDAAASDEQLTEVLAALEQEA